MNPRFIGDEPMSRTLSRSMASWSAAEYFTSVALPFSKSQRVLNRRLFSPSGRPENVIETLAFK
jgi:hypothetical protein